MLESKPCEHFPIIMDNLHWFRVPKEPGILKTGSNVVARFFNDLCDFDKFSGGVNAREGKQFHNFMWC